MKYPCRMDHLAFKTIGAETIILDSKINKEVHQLNEVAAFVWQLCDGKHNCDEIISSVCNEFDIDESTAKQDVLELVEELKLKSLLEEKA